MSDVVIRVENLSKQYSIGGPERAANMREVLTRAVTPWKHMGGVRGQPKETFWALKDVSFEVKRGEVVGVIGRNGAGKSTLLKVLSRITEPTGGRVMVTGRMGALLEVGTGFHPELTGRENIYLNGAILGMSQNEILKKFDEIIDFSEIHKFVDTPVKYYSSGMYLRLAFAVAAHLDPDILIVDEVLAVGDARFQDKCVARMNEVSSNGRTVMFVSHNMTAIQNLCSRCVYIKEGQVVEDGSVGAVTASYISAGQSVNRLVVELGNHENRSNRYKPIMKRLSIDAGAYHGEAGIIMTNQPVTFIVEWEAEDVMQVVTCGVVVKTIVGQPLFGVNNQVNGLSKMSTPSSSGKIQQTVKSLPLLPGRYVVDLYFGDSVMDYDIIKEATVFDVAAADVFESGKLPHAGAGPIFTPSVSEFV